MPKPTATAVVRPISVAEAFANPSFPALCREYAKEAAIAGLPDPREKLSAYQALEAGGSAAFCAYGAFLDDELIGFLALLTPVLPHYGAAIAVAESLFVAGAHRKTGAGLLLIRRAEKRAREAGSPGVLFSAPSGGRLSVLLPRIGYRETNRVYLKSFAHGADLIPVAGGTTARLPVMGQNEVEHVRRLERAALRLPQVDIPTDHVFHAGMYARTIKIPAGVALTGAQIKRPTILIISGDTLVYGESGPTRYTGYHVALGQSGRKQAFYALADTYLTMLFPTGATTADEAEKEFTDEHEKLISRKEPA